ncbi:MAG: FIST C-terminal domain-containing protein [Phycisphaerae bacterium]|nr:FIST C-terminal domain-containing protein [Phycisphaerae bacterium]MDW8263217.1 FIST N-terminal domain-containing protein [Phycisphaerales bacterium]
MQFVSAISDLPDASAAVEAVLAASRDLTAPDFAAVFVTAAHAGTSRWIVEQVQRGLAPRTLIGCTAEGIIGTAREIERAPGIVLLAGRMPQVQIHPAYVGMHEWDELLAEPAMLQERLRQQNQQGTMIGLGDPWSCPIDALMQQLDALSISLVGGMASSARRQGENRLFLNDRVFNEGFVCLTLQGAVRMDVIVSQGCRPIGQRFVVTRAERNIVYQLGGRPAMERLREVIESLSEPEKHLLRHGLFIGRAMSEYRDSFGRGDFLIRNVLRLEEESGALILGDVVRVGQTVQFHLRDAATAAEDLDCLLSGVGPPAPAAVLMFSCNGRGTRMFAEPGHDIGLVHRRLGAGLPVAGFFAAGEFGPVAGRNFIHGHTASLGLIRCG